MTASEDQPGPSLAGAGPGQATLATIRFLTELALLAVLAWAGVGASLPLAGRIVLAVAAPLVAVAIWGRWLAPRARSRLRARCASSSSWCCSRSRRPRWL